MPYISGSKPYAWPYDGQLSPANTALIVIDMQVDFCGEGGYVDRMGYDLALLRKPIEPIKQVLSACRAAGYTVIHTREGHRPDLSDLPANKLWRTEQAGAAVGSLGPTGRVLVRGQPGWELIPELAAIDGEIIIDKPGKGSFYATDLQLILHSRGVRNLVLCGVTTDVCVHTTMRDANDRGFECLLLSDCTGATNYDHHLAAVAMVTMQGGVFGAVATAAQFLNVIQPSSSGLGIVKTSAAGVTAELPTAKPYPYTLPIEKSALIMIDFQKDFVEDGGFGATLDNDVALLKAALPGAKALLDACRAAGMAIVHTLEAHLPDLSDLHASKHTRGNLPEGLRIGDKGSMGRILVRNEPGNGIVDVVAPIAGEKCVFKPGKGAFYNTDLQGWLQARGITHLLFAGVTTEVCVQTSMREANDRGYECCLITDAAASYFPAFHAVTCRMIVAQAGIVGWTATSADVASALAAAAAPGTP